MNATTKKKKEERRVIAPGITRDSERVYFDPEKTNIGKYVPYVKVRDVKESWRKSCERLFSKSTL